MEIKPPVPPFTVETAAQKTRLAEDAWNSRDPARVAQVYTEDTIWRNRVEFLTGREAIREFLERKWAREIDYRLIKELWGFREIAWPCAFLTNGATTATTGFAPTAMSFGSSPTAG